MSKIKFFVFESCIFSPSIQALNTVVMMFLQSEPDMVCLGSAEFIQIIFDQPYIEIMRIQISFNIWP